MTNPVTDEQVESWARMAWCDGLSPATATKVVDALRESRAREREAVELFRRVLDCASYATERGQPDGSTYELVSRMQAFLAAKEPKT